jgi:hypothetical protein
MIFATLNWLLFENPTLLVKDAGAKADANELAATSNTLNA